MTRAGTARQTQQQQPPPAVVGPSSGVSDSTSGNDFLDLQREAGNQAVADWLKARVNNPAFQEIGTPVVQQPIIQRKPANNGSAEPQAETEQKTETGSVARSLIVEDDAKSLEAGQMRKSEFLTELKTATTAAAEEVLAGTMWSAMGCPYIERWFTHYEGQSAQHVERAIQRYTPEARGARNARDYIPIVTNRLRRGIEQWRETGEVPPDMPEEVASGGMPGMTAGALIGGLVGGAVSAIGSAVSSAASGIGRALFKEREGGAEEANDPAAIKAQLGSGRSLDGTSKSQMESAYGADFSNVRIHTDAKAHQLSNSLNARAFTIGSDIAFGSGEYNPGTPVGDALLAHELAHVVQQGTGSFAATPLTKGGPSTDGLEEEADRAAAGAVISVWGGGEAKRGRIQTKARPRRRAGLQLQRCSGTKQEVKSPQDKAVSAEEAAHARFRSAKVAAREEKLAGAGKSLRELGTWAAAEQKRQNRPQITAVVGLDSKHRDNARQAVTDLQAIGPTFETKGLDDVITRLQESVKSAKSAKKFISSEDPVHQMEMRGELSNANDSLDQAVAALEKMSDSIDGYELWKEIEDARSLLVTARGGGDAAYDAIEGFDERIKAIRTKIRELQEKYKKYPQAIARIAFVVQYFVAVNTPGFTGLPSAAEVKKFKGSLAGGLSSDFALVFGGGGVHSPFEVFISYADILEEQLTVLEKMSAAGKPAKSPIPAQGEVEAYFKTLAKKSNKEVREAYEHYARAYYYHRIVTTVEDMAVKDVADLFTRDLSIAGTRPLVCSGYAILGAHLLTLAGGKVDKFITAVRATNEHIRTDTIDSGHAVAVINRGGKKLFVSNDSIFDTEKEAFDVAWGNPAAPMHQASGPTNNASLEALKKKLAKKMEQLQKK